MSIVINIGLVLLTVVVGAAVRQHVKYLDIRRVRAEDRQPMPTLERQALLAAISEVQELPSSPRQNRR